MGNSKQQSEVTAGTPSPERLGSECPSCKQTWIPDSEQAIHAELFGYCIACGAADNRKIFISETVHERVRRLDAKGEHHNYDILLDDPCDQTVQMADHILNHYSRDSRLDKICLARRLEKWAKEFTANGAGDGRCASPRTSPPPAARCGAKENT